MVPLSERASRPRHGLTRRRLLRAAAALASLSLLAPPVLAPRARAGVPPTLARRILVIGDSQAQGLAGGFMRRYRRDRDIRVIDRSKIATGLIPRASYDWPTEILTIAGKDHADVAVVMFGANDRPPVRRNGVLDPKLVEAFTDSYGSRVTEIVDALRAARTPVVWVGHPIVRDPDFASDMAMLDGIYETYATEAGATYVSTWNLFAAPDGSYSAYGPGLDGVTTRLRADDGVHLTPAGYDVLARMLEPYLEVPPPASAQALPN